MTVIEEKDIPEHLKENQKLAHDLAEFFFENVWNEAIIALDKKTHKKQITGNDTLSYLSTIIFHFTGRWIQEMYNQIASKDDAGFSPEDLIKEVLNGIITAFGGKAEYEEKQLPDGIKKLKKQALS